MSQFNSIAECRTFLDQYINNSVITAFQQQRVNTVLNAILDFIESGGSGGNTVSSEFFTPVESGTSLQSDNLINKTLLLVVRNGNVIKATTNAPTQSEQRYTTATGTIDFGQAFGPSEWVLVIYK